MWQYIQKIVLDPSMVGAYLTGPMGVGKSSIMYYVVHKAREEGWFVIYIPRCDEWIRKGNPSKIDWYSYFMDGILTGFKYVKSETIKTTYAYIIPPNNHPSWRVATLKEDLSLEYFHDVFTLFREQILMEGNIPVLLAFDECQALFDHGITIKVDAPFSLVDWASYYERGCVFVTATEDSPYRQSLRGGHEQYLRNAECLLEDEFALWIQTDQFDKIVKHPDFTVKYLP
jgi:Mitochondrial ribosomal death-associated protein 3